MQKKKQKKNIYIYKWHNFNQLLSADFTPTKCNKQGLQH